MTVQEQQMIDELVQRIRSTQLAEKDTDAEKRLQQGLAGYPDAVYVLAQTVLVQKYGLEQAQQQLQDMQAELDELRQPPPPPPAKSGGSFLGNLFGGGSHEQPQPGQAPGYPASSTPYQPVNNPGYPPYAEAAYPPYPPQGYPPQGYPQPPAYGQPMGYGAPMGGSPMGGGGGFLRSAMQTAAGVAAGEVAFQGIESLFRGFGEGHEGHGFSEGRPTEVVNNYYGEGEGGEHHHEASSSHDDSSFYNPDHDASRDDGKDRDSGVSKFADTDKDDDSKDDKDDFDDSGDDDSSNDDYDSTDDSSSSDDNGY
ncbi:DUF2076 domain-containing protein [Granulicella mallensis]|uniref:Putative periplasmic ligand-binding sensor protein n=1 Tax=Granulicella mallensis (strain ATCC BAA-1857 / DSM 23137 / MP5ACTX8) TaxID=682795 RepID=G8NS40_GRAMM|nr:DUF2076 domain-containing protein [Granulicella mallensis]AEU36248.1 putative periplasmic ligand-binding sensor protein [Granulicella mallensis MP5ACTX8]